ncbi:hypothetical protein TD95_003953, partial [Thielaviopsis punctulata]
IINPLPPPSTTMSDPAPMFAKLDTVDPTTTTFLHPAKRINDGADVSFFLRSRAYRDIGVWLLQLNRALCPRRSGPASRPVQYSLADADGALPGSVRAVRAAVARIDAMLADAPVEASDAARRKHRFGNPAFRRWVALVEAAARGLVGGLLGQAHSAHSAGATALDELVSYFVGGLGSAERLDYGTGHELSFLAFLGGLWKLGFFADGEQDGPIERAIVFGIFEPYLVLIRKVILLYRLEPAGSHGVWGLDDHFFLPYIFGSAQLTRPIYPSEPMPQEGSVQGAPRPSAVTDRDLVAAYAPRNMYFSAIAFIYAVKTGPFGEHSPVLYDVSGITTGWGKINKGMIKMFNAEVLSKFPVVQHFRFGGLFRWEEDPEAPVPQPSVHVTNQPQHSFQRPGAGAGAVTGTGTGTAAPLRHPGAAAPPTRIAASGSGTMAPWAVAGAHPAAQARAPPSGSAAWANATRMPGASSTTAGIPYSIVPSQQPTARQDASAGDASTTRPNASGGDASTTRAPWAK